MNKWAIDFGLIVVALHSFPFITMHTLSQQKRRVKLDLNALKPLRIKGLVPRAGIEPARPILSYPRILSPESENHNNLISLMNQVSSPSSGPHSGLTRFITIHQYQHIFRNLKNQLMKTTLKIFGGRDCEVVQALFIIAQSA